MKSGKRPPDCNDAFTRIEQTLLAGALLDGENGEGEMVRALRPGQRESRKQLNKATINSRINRDKLRYIFCQCDPPSGIDAVQQRVNIPSGGGTCGMPIFAYLCDIDLALVHDRNI